MELEKRPILLVCGCNKYKPTLIGALARFSHNDIKTIGIIGDQTLENPKFEDNILYLNVPDSYEYLPRKITAAMKWCYENIPCTPGIFKTDDDLIFNNTNELFNTILRNTELPWWGVRIEYIPEDRFILPMRIIDRYEDKSLKDIKCYRGTYFYGAGYWVSRSSIKTLIDNYDFFDLPGGEDCNIGHILSNNNVPAIEIKLPWHEQSR